MKDIEKKANGFAPCVGCERECPITADMTELTYDDGYEQAMIDCRDGAETSYLDGYFRTMPQLNIYHNPYYG